jgi:hypothetical protein
MACSLTLDRSSPCSSLFATLSMRSSTDPFPNHCDWYWNTLILACGIFLGSMFASRSQCTLSFFHVYSGSAPRPGMATILEVLSFHLPCSVYDHLLNFDREL